VKTATVAMRREETRYDEKKRVAAVGLSQIKYWGYMSGVMY